MRKRRVDLNELIIDLDGRRYDGGTEIELIAQIEAQQGRADNALRNHPGRLSSLEHPLDRKTPVRTTRPEHSLRQRSLEVGQEIPLTNRHQSPRWKYAVDTLIVGPLQIAVGLVGMLTSVLAIATFQKTQDAALREQSKTIFVDCGKTLLLGLWFTTIGPLRCLKTLILGPTLTPCR